MTAGEAPGISLKTAVLAGAAVCEGLGRALLYLCLCLTDKKN